jgi:hypothetical protein
MMDLAMNSMKIKFKKHTLAKPRMDGFIAVD